MKPLNLDNRPCSPISSNCVIWQGPDIPCIKLCTGDTVSDIVFKLGTELCTIMDQLNVNNYDLSCFNLTACPPQDFQALIQLLINKICEANGITSEPAKSAGCPDCVVTVAPCFIEGTTTTMQLVDYVQMIANKICSIISEIADINNQIDTINTTLVDIQNQIDNLPVYTLPSFPVNCILPPGNQALDVIVESLMNDTTLGYCALIGATGTPADINAAVLSQCITDIDQPLAALPAVSSFAAYYAGSWVNNATLTADPSAANAINNLWIAVCDLYNYVKNLVLTVTDTNTVNLTYTSGVLTAAVQDTGWVDLLGFTYMSGYTATKPQCRRIGNEIIFRGVIQIPMGNADDGAAGSAIPVNSPDQYSNQPFGKTLNMSLTTDPDACGILGSGPTGVIPSGSTNINEGIVLYFNRGQRVIPTSVVPAGINFGRDSTLGNRQIVARGLIKSGDSLVLTTVIGIAIDATGKLLFTTPYSVENYSGSGIEYNSMLRNIVSNIISGDAVPLYNPTAPSINNASAPGAYNADIIGSAITWPFTMNCMSAYQVGGFSVRLDGLRTYLDPCETSIPTPTPC